ncbi:hypothetical protein VNO78_28810 [Psophocarpus tetragonolobus]|uniref:Pentatricopeptide repeat-containing protein n=1 Tax=Psophocarpus tetragonolobus TaxID=3891 RepID=A0AAN9RU77_PSOTE
MNPLPHYNIAPLNFNMATYTYILFSQSRSTKFKLRLTQLLNSAKTIDHLKQIHALFLKLLTRQPPHHYHHFMDRLLRRVLHFAGENSSLCYAHRLFDTMPNCPDNFLWTSLIRAFLSHHSHLRHCISTYARMHQNGVFPSGFTFSSVLSACGRVPVLFEGKQVHTRVVQSGFLGNKIVQTALLDMYAKSDCTRDARDVFDTMDDRDVVTWTAMICGYAKVGMMVDARQLFDNMGERNSFTWTTMVAGYANCEDMKAAKELYDLMNEKNEITWIAMIAGYGKLGKVSEARRIFDGIPVPQGASPCAAMLACYAQNGYAKEAIDMYEKMREAKIKITEVAMVGAMSACAQLRDIRMSNTLTDHLDEGCCDRTNIVSNGFIHMHSKCGNINLASNEFSIMRYRDMYTYSAMIAAFAEHGKSEDAINLFLEMQKEGLKPNQVIFIGVLNACGSSGHIEDGCRFFQIMIELFGIEPLPEHYACIVDLLGRAGQLEMAYDVIKENTTSADATTWGSLLAACRVYGNVELGEIAARHLFEIDPEDSGNYVLLANTYASKDKWEHAQEVKKLISERRVKKPSGIGMLVMGMGDIEFCHKEGTLNSTYSKRYHEHWDKDDSLGKEHNRIISLKKMEKENGLSPNMDLQGAIPCRDINIMSRTSLYWEETTNAAQTFNMLHPLRKEPNTLTARKQFSLHTTRMEDGDTTEDAVVVPASNVDYDGDQRLFPHSSRHGDSEEESPHELLCNTKASIENIVAEILSLKHQGKPKPILTHRLRELLTQTLLHFVTLRQANRSILLEEERARTETERAKAPLELISQQLQNLMYEKSQYMKAIKACNDFKSKYPDIEVVSEEEFLLDAPQDMKDSILSNHSEHDIVLKRLNFELFQRKELCKLQNKLEQKRKALLETIANRKKFLSSLPSHLKSLKKASLPVQNQLGVQHTKKLKRHHLAELLPSPLYVIYSQLLAQKEAFGESIDVEIIGSVKDAQAFAHHQAHKDTGISTSVESSKLENDEPDEDGQRQGKRPRRFQGKESLDQAGIFQIHPLNVNLHVYDDEVSDLECAKLITLKFEYMMQLNIICVGIEASNDGPKNEILSNLFPDDTGLELPHQTAKLFVGDAIMFNGDRTSRPYKWAQHLAGIDFLPEVAPLLMVSHETSDSGEAARGEDVIPSLSQYRQRNRLQTVLQKIRSRTKAQLALQ